MSEQPTSNDDSYAVAAAIQMSDNSRTQDEVLAEFVAQARDVSTALRLLEAFVADDTASIGAVVNEITASDSWAGVMLAVAGCAVTLLKALDKAGGLAGGIDGWLQQPATEAAASDEPS